jgi:para-aminobenzoate synthetase component II
VRLLVVDHEDSFVHNIEQALSALGADVKVLRSTVAAGSAVRFDPHAVVLSPGPGHPSDRRLTRLSRALLARWEGERPFLGVCLGHQFLAEHYGARVVRARAPVHGERTRVVHDRRGLFSGLDSPLQVARYHSLVVDPKSVPSSLEVTSWGAGHVVMGLRHRRLAVESVQFHPESYLTAEGPRMFANFLYEARR